jgi:hypothetical protein
VEQAPVVSPIDLLKSWVSLGLDGEGVFEFFHACLQILDFSLLLFEQQMFDPVQARLDPL